ncbi:MAG: HAD family hydrolase [Cytophagales bacterium]
MKKKCVFLDRDGVINVDKVDYVYSIDEFKLLPGVIEALNILKENGFLLIVITNQSGIAKGIYSHHDVLICHEYFDSISGHLIDDYYYSPYHESTSNSLSRKPDSLMFERAIAKYNINIAESWMVGDKERDTLPAKKIGLKTIAVDDANNENRFADFFCHNLLDAAKKIAHSCAL